MSNKKTIGGDRLGSGKKMQAEMKNFGRSTHDLGYIWRSTMAPGTLVPFMCQVALPGDTWDIETDAAVNTQPTIGPLFGSFKAQYDYFLCPVRLYNSLLHNNALNIGRDMSQVKLPVLEVQVEGQFPYYVQDRNIDNVFTSPSSLPAYMGMRGWGANLGVANETRQFNALSILMYYDIYKCYYANKQEDNGVIINTPLATAPTLITDLEIDGVTIASFGGQGPGYTMTPTSTVTLTGSGVPVPTDIYILDAYGKWWPLVDLFSKWAYTGTTAQGWSITTGNIAIKEWAYKNQIPQGALKPELYAFPLTNIDTMREAILGFSSRINPFIINQAGIEPYDLLVDNGGPDPFVYRCGATQQGLAVKTYQSDLFNNWVNTEWIDGPGGINDITTIDTSAGLTMDALNWTKKVYEMLTRISISGGSYDDWQDAVWNHNRYVKAYTPMYMGGLSKEVIFQEVVSNSAQENEPLGTLAGRGVFSNKHKGGRVTINVDEPSYIIGICSLTPRIDYSQGNAWDVHLKTMNDFHMPDLDQIGFQDLITEQMAWWDTELIAGQWVQNTAGKQPAWTNYMTNVNKSYGNFAIEDNEMFMTLNRRYEQGFNGHIQDLTTYIDPRKYNFIFAETQLDAQNFWMQIAIDIECRRKMSAKVMPQV